MPNTLETKLSNAQVALVCATDADPGGYHGDGQARTDRIIQRAHYFLAFLEDADREKEE